jgi:hypothetical protein
MKRAALDQLLDAALELPWEEISTALGDLPQNKLGKILISEPRGRVLINRMMVAHAEARLPKKSYVLQMLGLDPNDEGHADLDVILRRLASKNFSGALTPGEVFDRMWEFMFFPDSVHRTHDVYVGRTALRTVRTALDKRYPKGAEFLFYLFLDAKNCDAIVGDLEERYNLMFKKFGARKANFWYWTQALRSVGPIVWAWGKKAALKPVLGVAAWAVARGLVGQESWLAALVEIWKRIRL